MPVQYWWCIEAYIHQRFLFAPCTSYGQSMSRPALTRSRAFMEATVEPKRASTTGDTRLPRAQAVCASLLQVVYLRLVTRPGVCLRLNTPPPLVPHAPRTGKVRASVCWHGLGLSWKLSWSPNGPALQEIRACLLHRPVHGSLLRVVYLSFIVQPKLANTLGDTRLSRAQALTWQFITGASLKL